MNEKTLVVKIREAFAATGPVALETVLTEMAGRVEALESALDKATAPAAE